MKRATILVMVMVAATAFANERSFNEEFNVSADAKLSLDCHKGNIKIRTHSQSVISVQARIYPDQGESPEAVDYLKINTRAGDDWVSVDVDFDPPSKGFGGLLGDQITMPMVDFEILIPDAAALELSSHKAHFDVEAGTGRVEVESHKGTGTIKGVRNDFELETHKGEFQIEVLELADMELETHKGDIEVVIHGAHDFVIRGETHKGKLSFEGRDVKVARDDDDDEELSVDYREGSGSNRIDISTHKGSINLRFQ